MIKWLVRIGCAIGVLLIAAVAALLLFGGGRRIAHAQTSVTMPYPAERIWPWIVEPTRLRQWLVGYIDSIPDEESQPGGAHLRLGARTTEVIGQGGRTWRIKSQITALSPPRHLGMHMTSDEFEDDTSYSLEDRDGQTVVTYRSDSHYTSLIVRLMSPIICHDVERKMQTDLGKLQQLLKTAPPVTVAPAQAGTASAFPGCCAPEPK